MQRYFILIVIILVVVGFMATYTVRFTERAVVTTFGKADAKSVQTEPGLKFKIPYVQKVTKYDTRARFLEGTPEQKPTADSRPVILTTFLTWSVSEPLQFYKNFSSGGERADDHYRQAEQYLQGQLRGAMSEVSNFRMDQLLSSTEEGSKITDLEQRMFAALTRSLQSQGINVEAVGVSAIELPEAVTQAVFDRMKATQEKLAKKFTSEGESSANTIKASAESDARRIIEFAKRLADGIRKQGDAEAAAYIKQMDQDPRLAVFLKNIDFMRAAFTTGRATLVLSTDLPGFSLLGFDALNRLKAGEIPAPDFSPLYSGDQAATPAREATP